MLFESAMVLAEKSLASRQYESSAGYLNEASRLFPEDPEPHRLPAQIYHESGREQEALVEQRRFRSLSAKIGAEHN